MSTLAQRIINETDSDFRGIFGYVDERYFEITKDRKSSNWYIVVEAPCGMKDYDGYWRDSADKTLAEAVDEAIRGACLDEPAQPHPEKQGGGL